MPHRRVPRLPSRVGSLNVALALAAMATIALANVPAAHAQRGADFPGGGPFGGGPRAAAAYGDAGEIAVPGQIQYCREAPGAQANFSGFNYGYPGWWALPWGFPLYSGYSTPPYGGTWGVYSGAGAVCLWRPT
jgi:hypothetical protein